MTVKELITKLQSVSQDAEVTACVTVIYKDSVEQLDGLVKDIADTSAETQNGNSICILAEHEA
jgi:hypothetical protein